ncbi:MAG: Glutaredoxin protein [Candidatus Brocadiaceae bacterium]|nr:Glutaredoxin protein [Candidatus Brocadiaceae bacterium]
MYRISTCHWCDKVETFLKKHGINYKSIVIDLLDGTEQENAIAESYHLSKQRSFPVTYIDGTCVIGFHESRLRHLLKLPSLREEQERIKIEDGEIKPGLSLRERDYHETIEKMRDWLVREAKSHGYTINPDKQVVEEILTGLAINEKRYGYKACPCRLATGKYQLDCDIICPCSYCFQDVEKNGRCYCSLFVSDRFVASDPALPQYVPDLRERSETGGSRVAPVAEEVCEVAAGAPAILLKTRIKVIGFMQDIADKNKAREGFLGMTSGLDTQATEVQWNEDTACVSKVINDTKVTIKLRQDQEVYTYQIICTAVNGKLTNGEKLFQRIDVPEHKNKLFECYLIVPGSTFTKEDLQLLLPGQRYMSHVYDKYKVAAGFEMEGTGKDTFVISPGDQMLDKIVEEIVALETNYQLLSVERQRYILAMDKLDILESTIVSKMRIVSMNLPKSLPESLKGWLHGLSNNFGDISGIAEESRHRMNDTLLKRDVIRRIFKDWGESDGGFNYPALSRFYLEKADTLGDQYQRLFIRIDGIRREMADLITMLRTKIDLILQEQSLELQRSMDETTKTQMMMQHTVEGLSVIVLSYYTIHLFGFVFESLEASHVINVSLTTAKAIFVPIAIGISWYLTFRARKLIKARSTQKSK